MLESVVCYGSENDDVVAWGHLLTGWLEVVGLGYHGASHKGLTEFAHEHKDRIQDVRINEWGHSDFAEPGVLVPFLLEYVLCPQKPCVTDDSGQV